VSWREELERCRPWIEAALEYSGGTHRFEDIELGIQEGRMQFWPAPAAAAITEVVVYPQSKALHVFLAGGEMAQLLDMIESAAAWGKDQGCSSMTMSGRKGWERVLGGHGWRPAMVVMEREIAG
jgi:hypothetical protein